MNSTAAAPLLYTFRRCPYAIRARMALAVAGVVYRRHEVALRDKPAAMMAVSPKGTVPVLVLPDGRIVDESLDIMRWALDQHDPEQWLAHDASIENEMTGLIALNDGPFKFHLDRMKYATRYPGAVATEHRSAAIALLMPLEQRLARSAYLFGGTRSFADVAIFPFVRQFAHADDAAFAAEPLPSLQAWLARWEASALFRSVMSKPV